MKVRFGFTVPLCLLVAGFYLTAVPAATAHAQNSNPDQPPAVLMIVTEMVKPGQAGSPHEKTEGAFAQAMRDAKWPTHYLGMNALSGPDRAVFLVPYDSFASLGKDTEDQAKNVSLSSALDSANIADGALLESHTTTIYTFRPDLSLRQGTDMGHTRYFEIIVFKVRDGHDRDFETLAKLYMKAYENFPNAHWDTFERTYGGDGDVFIVAMPMKSLAEVDANFANDKKLPSTVGADQLDAMEKMGTATVESSASNIYAINPKMSYPTDAWAQEDPSFWGQR
jgi:hypothetical protein